MVKEAVLLTQKGCNPCRIVKHLLEREGVAFREVDAATAEGARLIKRFRTRTTPTIELPSGRIIRGFGDKMCAAIKEKKWKK